MPRFVVTKKAGAEHRKYSGYKSLYPLPEAVV
jgi:hypothetical protein